MAFNLDERHLLQFIRRNTLYQFMRLCRTQAKMEA